MTDLEKHIYDSVKDRIPELLELVRNGKYESGFIRVPFMCGGCIDFLVYDTAKDKFTHIEYSKGVEGGISIGGLMSDHEAYFDAEDIKNFEFEI